ncbi:hypothetical protein FSARC_2887 [Fusarium sarcochroum]|uniref:ABM domain-containing protein n=1 Tax=Fusarium sarcochroum TaxID=1208366 RepID=A0A8H4U5M6_9HYPO|nr:hypothetical protein FSARC_2887 [Fusarium sarcochroum]
MPSVTEIAFLQLKPGYDEQKLRGILKDIQKTQAQWIREHQPNLLEGKPYDYTTDIWITEDEVPRLFLAAPWESVEAHGEWLKSKENASVIQELQGFISEDRDAVVMYHLKPAGETNDFRGDILGRGPVKIWKISVKPEEKTFLDKEYRVIEDQSPTELGQKVWAGWKIEEGDTEDMVIIASSSLEDVIESSIAVRFEDTRVSRSEHKPLMH